MLTLTLEVDVVPGTQLVALRDRIKDRVLEEARNKMNIDETLHRVDVKVHNWSASEAKIARQTRKLGVEKPLPKLPDLPDPEADSELSPP